MMEKHKCKLCLRNFSNGRALGGHMRSHMMNLPIPPKRNESPPPPPPPAIQLSFEAESASSPSSSSFENDKGALSLSYGLRENPKRSSRFADPEFFDAGSVILQDRESETESSKNPTRLRSKRKPREKNESASSASDTTTEEDVAFCLMMLSRDKWKRQRQQQHHESMEEEEEEEKYEEEEEEEEQEEEEESDDESEEMKSCKANTRVRGRYKCDTCNKVFKSYQALGGHRASHKKIKVVVEEPESEEHGNNNNNNVVEGSSSVPLVVVAEKKIHQCPVCFRVFASGQALGGHKRTHVIGSTATAVTVTAATATAVTTTTTEVRTSAKFGDSLIDLNLPAPMDEDDASQIEDSAVSDAEFVKSR